MLWLIYWLLIVCYVCNGISMIGFRWYFKLVRELGVLVCVFGILEFVRIDDVYDDYRCIWLMEVCMIIRGCGVVSV